MIARRLFSAFDRGYGRVEEGYSRWRGSRRAGSWGRGDPLEMQQVVTQFIADLEVLLAQQNTMQSRLELVGALRDRLVARVKLYKALGGGWQGAIGPTSG